MFAALAARADLVRMLLEAGAYPDAADSDGETALMFAIDAASMACVQLLLAAGASVDIMDHFGESPLQRALRLRLYTIADLLRDVAAEQ